MKSADYGGRNRGGVLLLWLQGDGRVNRSLVIADGQGGLPSNSIQDSDAVGWSVAAGPDAPDGSSALVAAGAPSGHSYSGYVMLLWLHKPNGTVADFALIGNDLGGVPGGLIESHSQFGAAVAFLGDLGPSGSTDTNALGLAVGAPFDTTSGGADKGVVFIFWLDTETGNATDWRKLANGLGGVATTAHSFGRAMQLMGNLPQSMGDSLLLAVGAPFASFGGRYTGAIFILELDREDANVTDWRLVTNGHSGLPMGVLPNSMVFGYPLGQLPTAAGEPCALVSRPFPIRLRAPATAPSKGALAWSDRYLNATGGAYIAVRPGLPRPISGWLLAASSASAGSTVGGGCRGETCAAPPSTTMVSEAAMVLDDGVDTWTLEGSLRYAATNITDQGLWAGFNATATATAPTATRAIDGFGGSCGQETLVFGSSAEVMSPGVVELRSLPCAATGEPAAPALRIDEAALATVNISAAAGLGQSVAVALSNASGGVRSALLAVGVPGNDSLLMLQVEAERAYDWRLASAQRLATGVGGVPSTAPIEGTQFGSSVAVVPSGADGEGLLLLVGAPRQGALQGPAGGLVGLAIDPATLEVQNGTEPLRLTQGTLAADLVAGGEFGAAVAVTHIDRDPTGAAWQLLVGAPGDDIESSGVVEPGALYLLYVDTSSMKTKQWSRLTTDRSPMLAPGSRFGSAISWLGDADGDGRQQEVAVGAPGDGSTAPSIFIGWFRSVSPRAPLAAYSWVQLQGDSPAGGALFGASLHPRWMGDRLHLLVGEQDAVAWLRLARIEHPRPPPWGTGVDMSVSAVTPATGLQYDEEAVVTVHGEALYEWDPLLGEDSALNPGVTVLVDGIAPGYCRDVAASADGSSLTCTLSPSLNRSRELSFWIGGAPVVDGTLAVESALAAVISNCSSTEPVLQSGGVPRTFHGRHLLPTSRFSAADIVATGAGVLKIGDISECQAQLTASGESVTCQSMPPGVGGPHPVRLLLPDGVESDTTASVSYQRALAIGISPTSVTRSRIATLDFEISGEAFGLKHSDVDNVTVGGNLCPVFEWESPSRLRCLGVSADFQNHVVLIAVAGLAGRMSEEVVQFPQPARVFAASPSRVPTRGNVTVEAYSEHLAPSRNVINNVLVGGVPCLAWEIASDSVLECVVPPGTGTDLSMAINTSTGYLTESALPAISYEAPRLQRATPAAVVANEAVRYSVTVFGSGFGVADKGQVQTVTVGGKSCGSIRHVSDSELTCLDVGAPWLDAGLVTVTISGQTATADLLEILPPSRCIGVNPSTISTSGERITVLGSGFGGSDGDILGVTVGGRNCSDVSLESSTLLSCFAPPGVGRDLDVVVDVRLNGATEPRPLLSYAPPGVKRIKVFEGDLASAVPTVFAGPDTTIDLKVVLEEAGSSLDDVEIAATTVLSQLVPWEEPCPLLERHNSEPGSPLAAVWCRGISLAQFPETGGPLSVKVVVGGQVTTATAADTVVVGRPFISAATPSSGLPTSGLDSHGDTVTVTLEGAGLGVVKSDVRSVSIGGRPCPAFKFKNNGLSSGPSLVVTVPAGVGANQPVTLTTRGGLSSMGDVALSYRPAEVATVSPEYALTGTGEASFNVTGTDFGNDPSQLSGISIGGQDCGESVWLSNTSARCLNVSRLLWETRSVTVTVGGQEGLKNSYFEPVGDPVISLVSPKLAAIGETLLLVGQNFGYETADVRVVTVGGQVCTGLSLRVNALACELPAPSAARAKAAVTDPSVLRDVPVVVENAAGRRSAPGRVSYSGSGLAPADAPSHISGWRVVNYDETLHLQWAYPSDDAMPGVEPVTSFSIEVRAVGDTEPAQSITALRSRLEASSTDTSDGMRVYRVAPVTFTKRPVLARLQASNSVGAGPWSGWTQPVPANCPTDGFLETQAPIVDWMCASCPVGAFCGGASAENVTALPGFWRVPWSRSGLGFAKCPRENSCVGYEEPGPSVSSPQSSSEAVGRLLSTDRPNLAEALAAEGPLPAVPLDRWGDPAAMERCEEGYHGTMCSSCQPGYTRWGSNGCRACKSGAAVALGMVGVVVLMFLIVSYLILSAIRSGTRQGPSATAAIKVVFSHLQTVAIAASFNLQWPESVLRLFAGMSTATSASSEVLSLDCAMSGQRDNGSIFFDKAAITLALPLLMIAFAAVVWLTIAWCRWDRRQAEQTGAPRPMVVQAALELAPVGKSNPLNARSGQRRQSRVRSVLLRQPVGARLQPPPPPPASLQAASSASEPGSLDSKSPRHGTLLRGNSWLRSLSGQLSISSKTIGARLSIWDKLLTAAVVILFLVHMSVTQTSLQLLTCRDVSPVAAGAEPVQPGSVVPSALPGLQAATSGGCDAEQTHRRLVQDLDVCCHDPKALRKMYGLGIPGLLVYAFGIPIVGALLLWRRRDSLHRPVTKATLGFLYVGFKADSYYWESVVMLRKVLVAVIAVSLEPMGATLQTYTALFLLFGNTVLHVSQWPYATQFLNRLELGALVTAFLTFECGLFLVDGATPRPVRVVATLGIFFANVGFLLAALLFSVAGQFSNVRCCLGPQGLPAWCGAAKRARPKAAAARGSLAVPPTA